jgi:hypothetical protein
MTIESAAFVVLVGMIPLTVLLLAEFIRDVAFAISGLIPAIRVLRSLVGLKYRNIHLDEINAEISTALEPQREARASTRDINRTGMGERTPFGSAVPTTLFVTTANNWTDSADSLTRRYSSRVSFFLGYSKLTLCFKPILFSLAITAASRLPENIRQAYDFLV